MPLPKNRTRKYKRMKRKTSKGTKDIFVRRKGQGYLCALCKTGLAGVRPGSRTEKSVSRRFGGHLCHACLERVIKEAVRVSEKEKSLDAVDLQDRKYVQRFMKQ